MVHPYTRVSMFLPLFQWSSYLPFVSWPIHLFSIPLSAAQVWSTLPAPWQCHSEEWLDTKNTWPLLASRLATPQTFEADFILWVEGYMRSIWNSNIQYRCSCCPLGIAVRLLALQSFQGNRVYCYLDPLYLLVSANLRRKTSSGSVYKCNFLTLYRIEHQLSVLAHLYSAAQQQGFQFWDLLDCFGLEASRDSKPKYLSISVPGSNTYLAD